MQTEWTHHNTALSLSTQCYQDARKKSVQRLFGWPSYFSFSTLELPLMEHNPLGTFMLHSHSHCSIVECILSTSICVYPGSKYLCIITIFWDLRPSLIKLSKELSFYSGMHSCLNKSKQFHRTVYSHIRKNIILMQKHPLWDLHSILTTHKQYLVASAHYFQELIRDCISTINIWFYNFTSALLISFYKRTSFALKQ